MNRKYSNEEIMLKTIMEKKITITTKYTIIVYIKIIMSPRSSNSESASVNDWSRGVKVNPVLRQIKRS